MTTEFVYKDRTVKIKEKNGIKHLFIDGIETRGDFICADSPATLARKMIDDEAAMREKWLARQNKGF